MRLLVTRHGQTTNNLYRIMQGQCDSPLTDLGILSAQELGQALSDTPIDVVIHTPLKRTRDTAKLIIGDRHIPMLVDERFIEMHLGTWEMQSVDELKDSGVMDVYLKDPEHYVPDHGGESYFDLENRLVDGLQDLAQRYPDKTVLVVCHAIVKRALIRYATQRPWPDFRNGKWPYGCSLTIFEVDPNGKPTLIEECLTDHLSNLTK
jgi:probable phosphoglycerate mutase